MEFGHREHVSQAERIARLDQRNMLPLFGIRSAHHSRIHANTG